MSDEHADNPLSADSATAGPPPGETYAISGESKSNGETAKPTPEEEQRRAAFRARQLFAEAQEQFAAGAFIEAGRRLKQIPEDARTADVQRLIGLVTERIREIADLRSSIQTALNNHKHVDLPAKLQRLLELQPGDSWANTIRHRLEEDEHREAAPKPAPFSKKDLYAQPPPRDLPTRDDEPQIAPPAPPPRRAVAVEIVDDEEADDVWDFGERLVQPVPPPVPETSQRPGPRSRPSSSPPRARPPAADVEDDFVGWLEPEGSSTGMWIAITVSGMVILLALIATIVVLMVEKGSG